MRVKNIIAVLVIVFYITSCVEKYWPEINKYENIIVVDGMLTNGDEPTTVRLSTSSSINNVDIIPLSGGELYISDENKVMTPLTETEPGTYQVLDISFRGQIGNSYQLHIELSDGQRYESDICRLAAPSPIDSVYEIIENRLYPNSIEESHGYQFYLNNHNESDNTSYYLWKLSQTFEYKSTFDINFIWDGTMIPFTNPDSLRTCWHTTDVNKILTYSTRNLNPPIITGLPLNFVSTKTKMLSIRYSLLVKQLSISEEAFNFWDALRQQNIDQGDLYSQQPIQIVGNIHPVNNTNEPVLGYFTIAGVTEKRVFVPRPVLPFYYDICEPNTENVGYILNGSSDLWPVYLTQTSGGLAIAAQDVCFDCRLEGGSITPPDFWEE